MNDRLLDDIVHDLDKDRADSEYIRDRFVDVGREYVENADDPTTEQVTVLVEHFEDRDPDDIDEETLSLLWTMCGVFRWMVDGLPLQGQTSDPEWLLEKLEFWAAIKGGTDKSDES
ncbi:hypothetical protein [Haloarchaeobius amylolyticus]|uniref:hypothetical protein n=1 Tax=Haloarchaeobius amylolyticus TaxID=1198296 RepID=UPI002270A4D8|nr:hypothetical protein [Haloarchaeobius amylolyticus]